MASGHRLLRRPTHGNSSKENQQAQSALNDNQYVGEIFVGRRKVWEGRAATKEQAFSQAKSQEAKYSGANPEIKVKRVKPVS